MTIAFRTDWAQTPGFLWPHLSMLGALALLDANNVPAVGGHDPTTGVPTVHAAPETLTEVVAREAARIAGDDSPWRVLAHNGKTLLGPTWHTLAAREPHTTTA